MSGQHIDHKHLFITPVKHLETALGKFGGVLVFFRRIIFERNLSHKWSNKFMHTKHLKTSQGRGYWHLPHHRQQRAQAIALNTHLKDILTFPMMLPTSYKRKKNRHKGISITKPEDYPAQPHNEAKSWCTLSPAGQGVLQA